MSRRNARIAAMQAIYQIDVSQKAGLDKEREEAVLSAFELGKDGEKLKLSEDDIVFSRALTDSVLDHQEAVDTAIASVSQEWKLSRMSAIDRSVLRLAVGELEFYQGESPATPSSIINEAVTIAKAFGTEKSGKFVNGVLADVLAAKDLEKNQGK